MGNIGYESTAQGGAGFGFGGYGGIGGVGLIGLVGINNLLGRGDGYGGGAVAAGAELRSELLQQTIANLTTANTNAQATNAAIGEAAEGVNNRLEGLSASIYSGFNNLAAIAQQTRYDNAISNCQQTNLLVSTINSGIQAIKDQMTATTIGNLERALAVAENGGPIVRAGAFVQPNPCHDNVRMNNIENTIVQIGSALSAVQTSLNSQK